MVIHYDINDIRPYISWVYFFHGWSMNGKDSAERDRMECLSCSTPMATATILS